MAEIIYLSEFQPHVAAPCPELSLVSEDNTRRVEGSPDSVPVRDGTQATGEVLAQEDSAPNASTATGQAEAPSNDTP